RVAHHVAIHSARDLAATVHQIARPWATRRSQHGAVPMSVGTAVVRRHRVPAEPHAAVEQGERTRIESPMHAKDEVQGIACEDVLAARSCYAQAMGGAHQNCVSSVDPATARVELAPSETAEAMRSKYPAPTSRWWRVAV